MIALIDSGSSTAAADVAGALDELKAEYKITRNEVFICNADKVIFPGSGEPARAIRQLHLNNLFSVLRMVKNPMLGISLGMQLMCSHQTEGNVGGLGIFPEDTRQFDSSNPAVSNTGWNKIDIKTSSRLFNGINSGEKFFFQNSFFIPVDELTTSVSDNGVQYAASIEKDNCFGVQFNPEKSGEAGLILLKNFIEL